MENINCARCNAEKSIDNFYIKYRECKACNNERVLKCYYNNKDIRLQQRQDKCAQIKDLGNSLKTLEKKAKSK